VFLVNFLSVAAAFRQSSFAACGFAQMNIAALTENDSLRVTKNGGDLKTSRALDIHEKRIGRLYESFQFVRSCLFFWRGV
jgi:hypothetical protein